MESKYSEYEKNFVIKNYNKMTKKEIAQHIGRSESSVKTFGRRNGLSGKGSDKWSGKDVEFLKDNYASMTQKELAKKLGRTPSAIKTKCSLLGLGKLDLSWSDFHADFLQKNYDSMTAKEIAEALNCKVSTVRNKAFNMGLLKERYSVNKDFFEVIDTEEKAYWLGFVFADGCVRKFKGKSNLCIGLAEGDGFHLEKFKKSLNSNSPISKKNGVHKITINCTKLANDLISLGCIPRKTYEELSIPNQVPNKLVRHFIRGYVDGDGWVTKYEYKGNKKQGVGICSLKENILKEFRDEFDKLDIKNKNKKITNDKSSNTYSLTYYSKADSYKILNYLYSESSIYLDRKYLKAQDIIQSVAPHQHP